VTIDDNAYTCGCHCDASPVTKTVTIVANSDDAEQDGTDVRLGGNDLHLGANIVGLRFTGVGIPPGATIASATVQFTASASDADPTNVPIVAELDADAKTFENTANNLSKVDGAAMPALTDTYTGLVNGNKSATFTGSLATTATVASWSAAGLDAGSPVVLRFEVGTGQRRPSSSRGSAHAAVLQVTFTAALDVDARSARRRTSWRRT
jgi:hypothetical protein